MPHTSQGKALGVGLGAAVKGITFSYIFLHFLLSLFVQAAITEYHRLGGL